MSPTKLHFVAALCCTVLLVGGAQAQQSETEFGTKTLGLSAETIAAACREGRLSLYSLIFGGRAATMHTKFRNRFPCISVDVFAASGGPLAQRFTSEFQAKTAGADLVMNSSPSLANKMIADGMFTTWTPPTAELVPKEWTRPGYWYAVGLTYLGMAWNTQEITAEEKAAIEKTTTWEQAINLPFKGRMAMVDIRAGGTTQLAYFFFKEAYGADAWRKLATQRPVMFNGINPLADRLVAGEFAFVPHATVDTAIAARYLQGAPVQWKFPEPGLAVPYFLAIAANAPHPNAAKVFLAWSLSPEGQSSWISESGLAPTSTHATDDRPYAKEPWYRLPKTNYQADWDKIEANFSAMSEEFRRTFGQ